MSDIQERLSQLSAEKRALLERMLLENAGAAAPPQKIPRRPNGSGAVLSQAEQRLWFVDRLEPDHPFYNMPLAARIRGPLDREAFVKAIQSVVDRHETLRSTYHLVDGQPKKRIADSMSIDPKFVDLAGELDETLRLAGRESFDIETGPLLRATVFKVSDDEHVVLLVMHHIVSDGWSMIVMLKEIASLYEGYRRSETNGLLDPLPIQYSDFAHWQSESLTEERIDGQLEYWRTALADAPEVLDFPTDFARPAVQDFEGATLPIELSPELSRSVNRLANENQCTPFMVFLATQSILLTKFARQDEIVLGTAVANRTEPELESLIGFFVGTLPLRIKTKGNPTFRELLAQAREVTLGAYDHADLPFERLVEELAPSRDRSYSPIFQAALVMQNLPRESGTEGSRTVEPIHIDNGTAKYDLSFFFWEEGDRFVGHVEYRTSLFKVDTIRRVIDSFESLLSGATERPDLEIGNLPVTTESQRQMVISEFNETNVDLPEPHLLHQVFEQWVQKRPNAVAIRCQGESVTYEQLNNAADRIAVDLIRQGAKREHAVVVAMPRSAELVAVMFGILKAGCTFVPIDPAVPALRIVDVAESVDALMVYATEDLAQSNLVGQMNSGVDQPIIDWETTDGTSVAKVEIDPRDRAYIIFTSGSTGASKGVEIEHRSIVNFVRAQTAKMGVTSDDRVLHAFSPSFDGALSEIILAVTNGATLVISPPGITRDPNALTRMLCEEEVTVGKFPPALLSMLESDALPHLKTVASAGDKLTQELASRWLSGRRFFNGYGPTEASVGVSMMELSDSMTSTKPPIGGPMQNMRMYVLDEQRQPVPIGMPGEIYIGGIGVGRGYLNDPELTAKAYVNDSFTDDGRDRMYRTGDLGRWLPEGVVEFLGRVDDQISLRGFRIEPGEIAGALEQLPEVRQAAVTLRGSEDSGQLVAYVVPESSDSVIQADNTLEHEHVAGWGNLFANAHRSSPPVLDPEFNVTGWISTYTGHPLPAEEMRQWADAAAKRIESLRPKRVLEIGCGTGLILLRVAGDCDAYVGTDLLSQSLDNVRQALKQRDDLAGKIELLHQPADQFESLSDRQFDLVIMNSVVQYFPSSDYLIDVIEKASQQLVNGGRMFIGDVRHLGLQEAMSASIELHQADDDMPIEKLRSRIRNRILHEEELLIAPAFFAALKSRIPRISSYDVQWKDVEFDNELSRFRYEVVLQFDERETGSSKTDHLTARPNATKDLAAVELIKGFEASSTVADLKQKLASVNAMQADAGSPAAGLANLTNNPLASRAEQQLTKHLRESLRDRLPLYMIPSAFVTLDEIPRTINGKVDKEALPAPTGRPEWMGSYEEPIDEHEELVVGIWEDLLDVRPIGTADNFFELGGHSMLAVRMMSEIERHTTVTIQLAALFQDPTAGHLASILRDPETGIVSPTVVPLRNVGTQTPLFCIHPAGGTVFCYMELAKALAADRRVYGIQASGIDGKRLPHDSLDEMAKHYAVSINEACPDGPLHLTGWSLGGNIAFEVARQLKRNGRTVGMVGLIDSGLLDDEVTLKEADFLPLIMALFPGAEQHFSLDELREKEPAEQLAYFTAQASKAGIVPDEQADQGGHIFQVFQSNVKAVHTYVAKRFDSEITLFRPTEQSKTNALFDDPSLGWREFASAVDVMEVPGDHAHMLQAPSVEVLAKQLDSAMQRAERMLKC